MPDTPPAQPTDPNSDPTSTTDPVVQPPFTPAPAEPPATGDTMTVAQAHALAEKARSDEKSKVYGKLEKARAEKKQLQVELKEKSEALTSTEAKVSELETTSLSETEQVRRKVKELEGQVQSTQQQLEAVVDEAAQQILDSKLEAHRTKRIAEEGIALAEMVTGNSVEEIEASVAQAKARETQIYERAEESVRKELGRSVPTPVAPGNPDRVGQGLLTPTDRRRIAKTRDPAEYAAQRAQLLERAKNRAG